jgi:hypothetical protein
LLQVRGEDAELVDLSLMGAKVSSGGPVVPNGDRRVADIAIWDLVMLFVIANTSRWSPASRGP